jgi:serine/threonine protein kinase
VDQDPTSSGAPAEGAATLDLSGRCVGSSYILIRPIGQGATGVVWRGVDRASGEPVAVKLLHDSLLRQPKLITRFVQERTILLMLRHRNVVRVRDLFSVGETLGLVMDLVPGGSLRDHLREHHTVPAAEAARLAAQVAAALAEAHELGIVHRDLKPDNILLHLEDGRPDTRLTDFGIARVLNTPALTTPNAVVGTPHYMAPEAFHGASANPAIDVYAVGVLLYELVSGRPPYDSDSVPDLMRRHLEGGPERRPGIPDELWDVITGCMAQKPRLRPTAAELVAELTAVAKATATTPPLPPPEPRPAAPAEERASGTRHPSAIVPAPRAPRRRNQAPGWRWARPGAMAGLVAGAMIASAVATTAWHLARAGDGSETVASQPLPAASAPANPAVTPRPSAHSGTPAPRLPAAADREARRKVPVATAQPLAPVRATTAPARRTTAPIQEAYGSEQCRQRFFFTDFRTPILAQSCQSVGRKVQASGKIAAPSDGAATMTVALQDAATGRTVAGPRRCSNVTFARQNITHECGPLTASPGHGRHYLTVVTWTYVLDGKSMTGSVNGEAFAW